MRFAFVHESYRELPPSGAVAAELRRRAIGFEWFTHPDDLPEAIKADDCLAVFGDLPTMAAVLARCGVADLVVPSYPAPLRRWLHRRVWVGRLESLREGPAGLLAPIFVKPVSTHLFGGAVFDSLDAARAHLGIDDATLLACSEVVEWTSECRCYLLDGRVAGAMVYRILGVPAAIELDCLDAPPSIKPDAATISAAVACFTRSGAAPTACALDFGVLAGGQTALVEANDAPALANMGLPLAAYVDFQAARWRELMVIAEERARSSAGVRVEPPHMPR